MILERRLSKSPSNLSVINEQYYTSRTPNESCMPTERSPRKLFGGGSRTPPPMPESLSTH